LSVGRIGVKGRLDPSQASSASGRWTGRPGPFPDNHGGDGRVSLWCPAPPGAQAETVGSEPDRFFEPATSANGTFADWLGVFLDTRADQLDRASLTAAIVEEIDRPIDYRPVATAGAARAADLLAALL
jgi:hypothetical protein